MKIGPITIGRGPNDDVLEAATALEKALRERDSFRDAADITREYSVETRERLADLELALEDVNWIKLGGEGGTEFTRSAIERICYLSRMNYIKNPLINRAVSLQAAYVFGQGINVGSKNTEINAVIQDFMDDTANKAELTSHQARMLKEVDLQVEGNLFFVLFGAADKTLKVRTLPVDEVRDIICNPDDAKEPWFYQRKWRARAFSFAQGTYSGDAQERVDYYPDWRYAQTMTPRLTEINGGTVHWESPVYHVKVGGLSYWRFGVPETYAALDWAQAYRAFLEDWSTITRALAKFAWSLSVTGGRAGVQAAKTRLNTTLATGGATESNPPPAAGSTFITSGPGQEINPIKTAGATTSAEDGRRLLLMVAAATGWPESFFGDVSVGTLATAKSLDRPSELKMIDRQTLWVDVYKDLISYAVALKRGTPDRAMQVELDEDEDIEVGFPPLLEHDVNEQVDAIVRAATLDGKAFAHVIPAELTARLLLDALGENDIDALLAGMDFALLAAPPEEAPDADEASAREAILVGAAKELRTALESLRQEKA